jgi:hypothetical protein
MYEIAAKPTVYNYRLYRSRLEARWAAFFDFVGWEFEYEPAHYDLKGWMPDFVIYTLGDLLIEVKPYAMWSQEMIDKMIIHRLNHRCGILTEDLFIFENFYSIGKYLNKTDDPLLKDIIIQYRGNLTPRTINQLWIEAANKVMYLKPE